MDEKIYHVWLQQALGVGATQGGDLLATYRSAKTIYDTAVILDDNLSAPQRKRLKDKDLSAAKEELKRLEDIGGFMITPEDTLYQALFDGMYAPPVAVYGMGDIFDPSLTPTVAVVGTRSCDETGALATRRLSAGLAAGGAVVVSGGADGIDAHALEAALDENGRCISFQACGLDVDYPRVTSALRRRLIENGGMILTEYPLGTPALRHHFRVRNRLISAASRGTLVVQAPRKSGALITANWAREQGRDVFTVPGPVGVYCCEGSNDLLKEGAQPVTVAADVLMMYIERYPFAVHIDRAVAAEERAEYAFRHGIKQQPEETQTPVIKRVAQSPPPPKAVVPCPDTASEETKVLYHALAEEAQSASELSLRCGMPTPKVLSTLTVMELQGLVKCGAGQRYALCES